MQRPEGFDPDFYLMVHGDVAESGIEARDHFDRFGRHEGRSGIPPDRGHISEHYVRDRYYFFHCAFQALAMNGIAGDYLEFGTGLGTSMWSAWKASEVAGVQCRFWAFDSFVGLPPVDNAVDASHPKWNEGQYSVQRDRFEHNLGAAGMPADLLVVVPGFFDESLREGHRPSPAPVCALAYVDCDMYTSTVPVLDYLRTVLTPGAIVGFDDWFCWSAEGHSGERIALEEFMRDHDEWTFNPYLPIGWHGLSFYVTRGG
jgi:O-methyltransferase